MRANLPLFFSLSPSRSLCENETTLAAENRRFRLEPFLRYFGSETKIGLQFAAKMLLPDSHPDPQSSIAA
uniref:Putative secreted protein n=1 Tax=Anopheles marajoara TaxID=58244 RepID=A0A2M4CEP8_9DIPT